MDTGPLNMQELDGFSSQVLLQPHSRKVAGSIFVGAVLGECESERFVSGCVTIQSRRDLADLADVQSRYTLGPAPKLTRYETLEVTALPTLWFQL